MGVSTGGSGGTNTMLSEINVTPLVDVMLVLLVIFMITTPIMHEAAREHSEVELDLPAVRDDTTRLALDEIDQLVLSIDENYQFFLGNAPLVDCGPYAEGDDPSRFDPCFDELQLRVQNNRRLQDDGRLYLMAHTEIPYGLVVGAMNRIRLAGVTQVGMVTNPELRASDGGE